ncbi:MAG: DNA/RNA non-specific endonuclease [Erysipelotrichaceae bacterium]|nr:DNA/RNA non-specific endonuclease [Erysipelotrichaceae bacterium]
MRKIIILCICLCLTGCQIFKQNDTTDYSVTDIPSYSGEPYVILHNNKPEIDHLKVIKKSDEYYSPLDDLGRAGYCIARISKATMPTEERGPIGMIRPSGWHLIKYDFIDGRYLYNRCHIIGYQLTGENANECNLMTGTRYFNIHGMLPFENQVARYIRDTNHHVYYEVTPVFHKRNLLAHGVQIEAMSVEDKGRGLSLNVFVYNVQPGVTINYKNGNSKIAAED